MNFYTGTRGSWFQESKEYFPLFRYAAVTCFFWFCSLAPAVWTICSFSVMRRCIYLWIRKPNWGLPGLLGNLPSVQISVASCVWRWHWWITFNRIRPSIFYNPVKNCTRRFDQAIHVSPVNAPRLRLLDYETCSFLKNWGAFNVPSIFLQIWGIFMSVCIQMHMIHGLSLLS